MAPKKTILLIDDEIDLVESLQDLLVQSGYKIVTAFNGIEGLQRLSQSRPDLIVLDMNMPIMGGLAFIQQLMEAQKGNLPCPILVLSARINLESVFRDLQIEFMPKPFQLDDLLKKIDALLNPPLLKKEEENTDSEKTKTSEESVTDSRSRILIIEKNGKVLHQLAGLFEAANYHVLSASRGTEGIQKASSLTFEAILIHQDLDDVPADVLALKLKMLPNVTEIPVILYTEKDKWPDTYTAASRIYDKLNVKLLANMKDLNAIFTQTLSLLPKEV